MTPEDLRRLMEYLQERVHMPDARSVAFELPDESTMVEAGLHPDAIHQLLGAPWLDEMVSDIRETPEYCAPDEAPDQILQYARDVVAECLRKRFVL